MPGFRTTVCRPIHSPVTSSALRTPSLGEAMPGAAAGPDAQPPGAARWHFDRFPYAVVYEVDEHAGPRIYAIAHRHREPRYWSARAWTSRAASSAARPFARAGPPPATPQPAPNRSILILRIDTTGGAK